MSVVYLMGVSRGKPERTHPERFLLATTILLRPRELSSSASFPVAYARYGCVAARFERLRSRADLSKIECFQDLMRSRKAAAD